MILQIESGHWYIDVRGPGSSEEQSLDLTVHLARRISAGQVVVVCKEPKVFSSVIRKRWIRLIQEVEVQRSSTLNSLRRMGLEQEVQKMKSCKFSAKPKEKMPKNVQVSFISPQQVQDELEEYVTLYIATPLLSSQTLSVMKKLRKGGLIVIYGEWTVEYETILQESFKNLCPQY